MTLAHYQYEQAPSLERPATGVDDNALSHRNHRCIHGSLILSPRSHRFLQLVIALTFYDVTACPPLILLCIAPTQELAHSRFIVVAMLSNEADGESKQAFRSLNDFPTLPPAHPPHHPQHHHRHQPQQQQQHHPPNLTIPPPLSAASISPLSPDELNSPPLPIAPLSPSQVHDPDAPIIPLAIVGSGAHDECSATCILSHPTRSALIFVSVMFTIVSITTLLLILVKAVRGDDPPPSSSSTSVSSSSDGVMLPLNGEDLAVLPESNITLILPLMSAAYKTTAISASAMLHSLEDQLAHNPGLHMTIEVLSSVTPKVPDDGDMVSALIMLMWGLSPLISAVSTIAWTYYTFRGKDDFEASHEQGHTGETYHHHHHPRLVNTNPPLSSDEPGQKFALYPPSASSGSPGARHSPAAHGSPAATTASSPREQDRRGSVQEVDTAVAVVVPTTALARAVTAFVPSSRSQLTRRNVSPPPSGLNPSLSTSPANPTTSPTVDLPTPTSQTLPPLRRSVSAPSAPADHVASIAVSRQRCARVHTIRPFYSRRSPVRPRFFWFIPTSKAELVSMYKPTRRFLIRCYFLPILIPTLAAIVQYVSGGVFGINGWLSSDFVPTLTSAISLPQTVAGEVWACVLAFWYELLFGCWWDPFPPGSADWGKGMNFHGASWMALSAMEEIGWAGVLFPCLYELFPHNPTKASLICGLVWSAWHWPFLLFGQLGWLPESAAYHSGLLSTPWLYGFVMFTLSTTFSRVIMVRLLMWSDDLWSQCVYHAAHNVMVFNFFAQLPETNEQLFPYAGLWVAEAGVPVVVLYMAVAGWTIKGWYEADAQRIAESRLQHTRSMPPRIASGGEQSSSSSSSKPGQAGVQRELSGGEMRGDWPAMSPIEEEKTKDNAELFSPEERATNAKKVRFSKETVDMKEPLLMQG